MDSLRIAAREKNSHAACCCRCTLGEGPWDRVAGKAYCPRCQEALALGEGAPLIERTSRKPCAVCSRPGTICYQTLPLHSDAAVEFDVCAEHFRDLLGRRLGPHAFHQLRRRLTTLGIAVEQIFLLHDAFYDKQGRALQPAVAGNP
jgi:hypothetical protein